MPQCKEKFSVEVSFSPKLYEHKLTDKNFITVVVDILRASTSICAALAHGVHEIIPVEGIEHIEKYKQQGFIAACERNGHVVDIADMGNSASEFLDDRLIGKSIVFSTTNGTRIVNMARDADMVVIGSFLNMNALASWLKDQHKNVVIFCAAWKNLFNLEDSVFAGALAELLLEDKCFDTTCDSTKAAIDLWHHAKPDLKYYLSKSSHRNRLKHLVSEEDFLYTLTPDSTDVIPVLNGRGLRAIVKEKK